MTPLDAKQRASLPDSAFARCLRGYPRPGSFCSIHDEEIAHAAPPEKNAPRPIAIAQ